MVLRSRTKHVIRFGAAVAGLALALFCAGLYREDSASHEAAVCSAVCRELALNTTEGRQALVSSVWWPPLPFLLRLPVYLFLPSERLLAASIAVSVLMGVASLLLLLRILTQWGLPWAWRYALAAVLLVHGPFLRACTDGSSGTTVVYLSLLTVYGFAGWVEWRSLRSLVYVGFGVALLVLTSLEMATWGLLLLLFLLGDLLARPTAPRQREAVLVMVLTPVLYACALWVLMNWLVMGDGLYFLRSLFRSRMLSPLLPQPPGRGLEHDVGAGVALALCLGCLVARRRRGMYLALASAAPLAVAYFLNASGAMWTPEPLLSSMLPLCLVACASVASGPGKLAVVRRWLAMAALVSLLLIGLVSTPTPSSPPPSAGDVQRWEAEWSGLVEQHVLARSRYAKVYVCGYDSFLFSKGGEDSVFVHSLDFNFNKAMADYRGHTLFLLLHEPVGRNAMDSIHWKFPDMHRFGGQGVLYDGDFGPWRLYEVFQAPISPEPAGLTPRGSEESSVGSNEDGV